MIPSNPNKTLTIEGNWLAEVNRRFARVARAMRQIPLSSIRTNISDADMREINEFIQRFRAHIVAIVMQENWFWRYQDLAYGRGVEQVNKSLRAQLRNQAGAFTDLTKTEISIIMTMEGHRNQRERLQERSELSMNRYITTLLDATKNILHEQKGIVAVPDIHKSIAERINATKSSARKLASYEVSQAHKIASVTHAQELQVRTDTELEMLWITQDDSRVRQRHASWHLVTMSLEQAARNITVNPFNCRCGLKAIVAGSLTDKQKAMFKRERQQLTALVA